MGGTQARPDAFLASSPGLPFVDGWRASLRRINQLLEAGADEPPG